MNAGESDSRGHTYLPELFAHDFLTPELRRKIVATWKQALASLGGSELEHASMIRKVACEQHGLEYLWSAAASDADDLQACLRHSPKTEVVLDVVGFSLLMLAAHGLDAIAQQAVATVNDLFRQHGAGSAFAFDDGVLLRAEDRTRHNQLVTPALVVLAKPEHALAAARYQAAFADYDGGCWNGCMGKCREALQAVLQASLAARNLTALPQRLSADAITVFLKEHDLPAAFERPLTLLGSLTALLAADRAAHLARMENDRISPQQAKTALHSTAAAVLVLASANG